jgi:hypothetical protein
VRLDDVPGPVAAVVALASDALVAFDFLAEGVLAAREDKTHDVVLGGREFWPARNGRSGVVGSLARDKRYQRS